MAGDVFDHIKNQKPSNSKIQDARRRMNQRPAINRAQVTANDGVARGSAAQQRADEAHSRLTNVSLDNAHVKAEARYTKNGSEPALFFLSNVNVGTGAVTIVKHSPADDDEVLLGHAAGGTMFLRNNATAKDLLVMRRTGHCEFPSGNLNVAGRVFAGAIEPHFEGNPALCPANGAVLYTHGFGTFPVSVNAYVITAKDSAGNVTQWRPLPFQGVQVSAVTKFQIQMQNTSTTDREVGVYLLKG